MPLAAHKKTKSTTTRRPFGSEITQKLWEFEQGSRPQRLIALRANS